MCEKNSDLSQKPNLIYLWERSESSQKPNPIHVIKVKWIITEIELDLRVRKKWIIPETEQWQYLHQPSSFTRAWDQHRATVDPEAELSRHETRINSKSKKYNKLWSQMYYRNYNPETDL